MRASSSGTEIAELAELILGARDRPLVVISTSDSSGESTYDSEHVESELRAA